MASSPDHVSMALFCDFENVALGVRDANYEKFDIKRILERLLLKGSIVVKKAYCDWDRYKGFKATMHEANFELIEIPHVRQSGKNSADIRLVVDALDLCYTKSHVNTFVIISGDSDFSPLVSKLRENAKKVIGVGVKQSTSDLLIANCDEFIFYDDLVRESQRALARRQPADAPAAPRRSPEEERQRKETLDKRRSQAIEIAVETFDALVSERGDSGKIWASVLKEAIKRRKPDFSESYYGFKTFGNLLEEAQARGLLEFGRDDKSGAYVFRSSGAPARIEAAVERSASGFSGPQAEDRAEAASASEGAEPRRRGRGGRKPAPLAVEAETVPVPAEALSPVARDGQRKTEPAAASVAQASSQGVDADTEFELERPSYFSRPVQVAPAVPALASVPAPVSLVEALEPTVPDGLTEASTEAEPLAEPAPKAAPRKRTARKSAPKPAKAVAEPVALAAPEADHSAAIQVPAALEQAAADPDVGEAVAPRKTARPRRARKTPGASDAS
ncbi:NYN domain-containing protein [Malikia sp.]|uniref:NYN domain-containing protein n=1 Tax=Malikia sp. TaxID=2070706 RepID=UPI00262AD50C|nr:NYN domain-containing protein [Malikia sp.]MDD2729277.1 NYN domain-containing protein [Malikia sp.]